MSTKSDGDSLGVAARILTKRERERIYGFGRLLRRHGAVRAIGDVLRDLSGKAQR